jgi:Ca-activated chloride channel family protein
LKAGAAALAASLLAGAARADEPKLAIREPGQDAQVFGAQMLKAELLPARSAADVLRFSFSVDGTTLCRRAGPPFECQWDAGSGREAHTVSATALLKDGRRLTAEVKTRGVIALAPVEVDVVYVAATITDAKGRALPGLGQADFRLTEDGVPQEIGHFIGPEDARELVVAIDISASMAPAVPQLRRAVRALCDALRPEDHVTLLAFNDSVFTAAARDAGAAQCRAAASRLAAWGGTALYDVILHALTLLDKQRGRKALVVFTDGNDRSSVAGLADVGRRSETSAAPIYLVAQGRGTESGEVLQRLASISGGRAFLEHGPEQLEGAFADILADLDSQYLLGYVPRNPERDGSWRTIGVSAGAGRQVRAREGYRAVVVKR